MKRPMAVKFRLFRAGIANPDLIGDTTCHDQNLRRMAKYGLLIAALIEIWPGLATEVSRV